ncbi:hypothetical protein U6G28_02720 [Actinomycetaceae bacterium MB13-C1-2]|nr:hypothetical protein U6G28_02720 [Actinomycetaceae bacterium MB13-C1-2]
MSVPEDWLEYRRGDRELVGWIAPEGEGFVTFDLLGRKGEATDWTSAEERLDELGIGYLADLYGFRTDDGSWVRVKLIEVSPDGIKMKRDDFGDVTADLPKYSMQFPIDDRLMPLDDLVEDTHLIHSSE